MIMSELSEIGEEVATSEIEKSTLIPIHLFNRKSSKFFKLINNTTSPSVKLNRQPYSLTFKSLIYLETFEINIEGDKKNKYEVTACRDGKEIKTFSLQCEDGKCSEYIDLMVDKIVIKPENIFNRKNVKSINLYGFVRFKYEQLEKKIYDATLHRNRFEKEYGIRIKEIDDKNAALDKNIEDTNALLEETKEKIKDNNEEIIGLNKDVQTEKDNYNTLVSNVANRKEKFDDLGQKNEALTTKNENLRGDIKAITADIKEKEKRLRELTADVNLFTDEISAFAKESNKHIKMYMFFAAVPFAIMTYVAIELITQAETFVSFYKEDTWYDIWEIFLARLPFVAISVFLIEVSFFIIWSIYKRILSIHQQRLSISKLSIIARDISDYASDDLDDLSDDSKYQLRTALKMDLIKAHLVNELGKDYKYTPANEKMNRLWSMIKRKSDSSSENEQQN